MANRIDATFAQLKNQKRKALIAYITAGFPTKASFKPLVSLMQKSGVDLLEVGVPFSDPIADGPTIQHASQVALQNGVTTAWILKCVQALRRGGLKLPIIFMSYANCIHAMGIDRFFAAAHAAGVDGLIIPDMIPEEGGPYAHAASKHHIDLIYLATPTTPRPRLRTIAAKTRGFLYAVSLTGVTGVQAAIPSKISGFLRAARAASSKPVAVGFGVTTPQQVRRMASQADGVIVGSALIRAIEKSKGSRFRGAARFIRSLKGALHAS